MDVDVDSVEPPGRAKCLHESAAGAPATSASLERLFSSVGLVKSDLRGRLLDNTLIDGMWAKQAP